MAILVGGRVAIPDPRGCIPTGSDASCSVESRAMATSTTRNPTSAVERRVRQFYQLLNAHEFGKCFTMIDPIIRSSSASVTAYQYENALRQFTAYYTRIELRSVTLQVHLDEPSDLFGNRHFAIGQ